MEKLKILIAGTDIQYVHVLERKFTGEINDVAEVAVITDRAFFAEYFSSPRNIDLLILSEELYDQGIERHAIPNIFILTEVRSLTPINGHSCVYKYSPAKRIFDTIYGQSTFGGSERLTHKHNTGTQVVAVYSPIGGAGKTTVAVSLACALAIQKKRVLFIATDSMQNFNFLLSEKTVSMPEGSELLLINESRSNDPFASCMQYIKSEVFNYLPPFSHSLASLGIKAEHFMNFCQYAKRANAYDVIIVDCSSDFFKGTSRLLGYADVRLIVVNQDFIECSKLCRFINNYDNSDGRSIYICNKYDVNKKNYLISESISKHISISFYLDNSPDFTAGIARISNNPQIAALSEIL